MQQYTKYICIKDLIELTVHTASTQSACHGFLCGLTTSIFDREI